MRIHPDPVVRELALESMRALIRRNRHPRLDTKSYIVSGIMVHQDAWINAEYSAAHTDMANAAEKARARAHALLPFYLRWFTSPYETPFR